MVLRREASIILAATALTVASAAYYLTRPVTLSIAVAPSGGTEPALLKAFAELLATRKEAIRLRIVPFDGVRESAEALQSKTVDLAVVRPDIRMPDNGLTLAILREQAVFVAAPESAGIREFADIAGKRLGFPAGRTTDQGLIRMLVKAEGLSVAADAPGLDAADAVAFVPVEETEIAKALDDKRIEAVIVLTTPTTPAARRIVGAVQAASADRAVTIVGVPDAAALVKRLPKLQPVTIASGLFGSHPRVPAEEVATIGTSYRLMARATLSQSRAAEVTEDLFELRGALAESQPAANAIEPPAYETTAGATSARLPNHPGAIDYFEREQETLIERYETWIYLILFFGGGIGSALAWLRQRVWRMRRERVEIATERLLKIRSDARQITDPAKLAAMAGEIDDLAANIARAALSRPAETRTMSAAMIAIDAARSTVTRLAKADGLDPRQSDKPPLRAVD